MQKRYLGKLFALLQFLILILIGCRNVSNRYDLDLVLRSMLEDQGISYSSFEPGPPGTEPVIKLGEALFFDKILSGNRDTSCATCHHPLMHTSDGLSLPIGVGGKGLGPTREMGIGRQRIPRNSPDIFNRADPAWRTMFWDGRVSGSPEEGFISPAGEILPEGLVNTLAVQAMFPVTSIDEMRGNPGDIDSFGHSNELAEFTEKNFEAIWDGLMARLLSIPEYVQLFSNAYPTIPLRELGFEHAANAIAAYEGTTWTLVDSDWDHYLAGNNESLSIKEKKGALVFYGVGKCSSCHATNLLTDQDFHNIAIPQLGPGKDLNSTLDYGRWHVTNNLDDRFAFRTPPLRNVALTGPWMHNGAYTDLEDAVRHHLNPAQELQEYIPDHLPPDLQDTCKVDQETVKMILETLDPILIGGIELTDQQVEDLLSFLYALNSPSSLDLSRNIPQHVPSGLPISE